MTEGNNLLSMNVDSLSADFNSTTLCGVFGPEDQDHTAALDLGPSSRTRRSAGVIDLQGVGEIIYRLHTDTDSEMRDRCIAAGSVLC